MARTKTKPGPKPKYGEREEIHVRVPVEDMAYIHSVTDNVTEWVVQAIQEKRQRDSETNKPESSPTPDRSYRRVFERGGFDRKQSQPAAEHIVKEDEGATAVDERAHELAVRPGMTSDQFIAEYARSLAGDGRVTADHRWRAREALGILERSYGVCIGSEAMRSAAYKTMVRAGLIPASEAGLVTT